jgi:methanol metabolism-related c-type cytochrome
MNISGGLMAGTLARTLLLSGVLAGWALMAYGAQGEKTVEDGKYMTKDGVPTYNVGQDGAVDWFTFSGFRRYHSDCHVCHGPDGLGSTYAPALTDSVKRMSYEDFQSVVANGRQVAGASGNSVMPAFGTNRNVMCYLDDIWIYLKARADEAAPRGRPAKREAQPEANKEHEKACMEG